MSDTFADDAERLHGTAAALPRLLDEAVQGVSAYAAAVAELVQNLDARRGILNERAKDLGAPQIPDLVSGSVPPGDAVKARLLAAARLGAAELAVGLGNAARGPARRPGAATPFEAETMAGAARAAMALLTVEHHGIEGVTAGELLADADPSATAQLLAGLVVGLAAKAMPDRDVAEWITSLAAVWSRDGD